MSELVISELVVEVAGQIIINGVDLTINPGEVHALMGPNGSGKSSLSAALMGKPGYKVLSGSVTLAGEDVLALPTWQRSRLGLFLAMQYPTEIPGVSLADLVSNTDIDIAVEEGLKTEAAKLGHDPALLDRGVNVDLSGGEKKRSETIQLAMSNAKYAILDELDSGLDVDSLAKVSARVEELTSEMNLGVLVITHYNRLLHELKADHVHIFSEGKIVASGGPELALELEDTGYAAYSSANA